MRTILRPVRRLRPRAHTFDTTTCAGPLNSVTSSSCPRVPHPSVGAWRAASHFANTPAQRGPRARPGRPSLCQACPHAARAAQTLRKRVRSASRSRRFMQSSQCALHSSVRPILARQLRPGPTGRPRGAEGRFERLPRPTPEQDRAHDSRCTPRAAHRAAHEVVPVASGGRRCAGGPRASCAPRALILR